ncbi:hypothetical protein [Nitrosomonas sp. Nm33]|uniref:hypothetical protein n=1 Tax=Nitrosomonas sp. Nm33 TaxID=133724 RepID=UPI000B81CF9B|nr:hypothetical protein [Nitrosomonas sp. Nm33]
MFPFACRWQGNGKSIVIIDNAFFRQHFVQTAHNAGCGKLIVHNEFDCSPCFKLLNHQRPTNGVILVDETEVTDSRRDFKN